MFDARTPFPPTGTGVPTPLHVAFVLDASGSMQPLAGAAGVRKRARALKTDALFAEAGQTEDGYLSGPVRGGGDVGAEGGER